MVPAARRHIIRRPRLTRLLDESGARIILLVAPAGYGKTTLAREWLEEGNRNAAWYRCGPATADVAAASVGISTAVSALVPGAEDRLSKRLLATPHPDEDVRELAEILVEDIHEWEPNAWLVIDDYHFAVQSGPTERFVQYLLDASSIQVLIASRRRPVWASARRRTYGEILEVDRTQLSMTDDEGLAVLTTWPNALPLLKRAQGWPAVIGLAALTGEDVIPEDDLPATLYDYIAEELYAEADEETRWGLCQLAIAGSVTRDLGELLLGDRLQPVLEHGMRLGIAGEQGRRDVIELHPLLQRFLREKIHEFSEAAVRASVSEVASHLLEANKWDEVFEVVQNFPSLETFETLLSASLPSLLAAGRVSTVQRWVEYAAEEFFRAPIVDFAEAELSVRQGLYRKAETLALQAAAKTDASWRAAAFTRAGRAAHLDGRSSEAIQSHRLALAATPSASVEREALWGLLVALVEAEQIEAAEETLETLDSNTGASVADMLRVASGKLLISVRGGRPADASSLTAALPLVDQCRDPMARSSFLNSCVVAFTLNSRYHEAHVTAMQLLGEAEAFRLRFVLPYAHLRLASVAAGQRRFGEALNSVQTAEELAAGVSDRWMAGAVPAVRSLILLSTGDARGAVLAAHPGMDLSPSVRAEVLAIQALGLACMGEDKRARIVADEARATSMTLEARSIGCIADAIAACVSNDAHSSRACFRALEFTTEHATLDHFVTGYRAFPGLLEPLIAAKDARIATLMRDAGDEQLASELGVVMPRDSDALGPILSPREREVFDLMAGGLTNKAIAAKLYISESTTKVHVRHIFEKLGARTRTEAVRKGRETLASGG